MTREKKMKTLARFLAAAALASVPAWAGGIAFISDVKGGAQLDGTAPAKLLAELPAGAKLRLAPGAQVSVMYIATGREYVLKGPGDYELREKEVAAAQGAAPQARPTEWRASNQVLAQVSQTSAASVRMRSVAKARDAQPAAFPAEGSIATLQPTFRWSGAAATGQFFLVADGHEAPVHSAKTTGATYRLPAKLKPDTEYYWRVSTTDGDVASGRFRTLTADAVRTVEARRPAAKAGFSDRLLFALMLEEMGARQEARELFAALAQERTDLPELAALAK